MNKEQIKDEIKATIVSEMEHNLRMGFDGSNGKTTEVNLFPLGQYGK